MYNKRQYHKYNDKKVLHKVRKQWVTISLSLLMMIGGGAVATHVSANASQTEKAPITYVQNKNNNAKKSQNITTRAKQMHSHLLSNAINNKQHKTKARKQVNTTHQGNLVTVNNKPVKHISNVNHLKVNQSGMFKKQVYNRFSLPFYKALINRSTRLHRTVTLSDTRNYGHLRRGNIVNISRAFKDYGHYGDYLRYEVPLRNKRSAFITGDYHNISYIAPTTNYRYYQRKINHILKHSSNKKFSKIRKSVNKLAKRENRNYRKYMNLYIEAYSTQQNLHHPVVVNYNNRRNHKAVNKNTTSDYQNQSDLVQQLENNSGANNNVNTPASASNTSNNMSNSNSVSSASINQTPVVPNIPNMPVIPSDNGGNITPASSSNNNSASASASASASTSKSASVSKSAKDASYAYSAASSADSSIANFYKNSVSVLVSVANKSKANSAASSADKSIESSIANSYAKSTENTNSYKNSLNTANSKAASSAASSADKSIESSIANSYAHSADESIASSESASASMNGILAQMKSEVFKDINADRAKYNKAPLSETNDLDKLANMRGQQLTKVFSHTNKPKNAGTNILYPIDARKLGVNMNGQTEENIGYMFPGFLASNTGDQVADTIDNNMMYHDSQSQWGHRDNILNSDIHQIGVGTSYDGKGNFYIAEDFDTNTSDNDGGFLTKSNITIASKTVAAYSQEASNDFANSALSYNSNYYNEASDDVNTINTASQNINEDLSSLNSNGVDNADSELQSAKNAVNNENNVVSLANSYIREPSVSNIVTNLSTVNSYYDDTSKDMVNSQVQADYTVESEIDNDKTSISNIYSVMKNGLNNPNSSAISSANSEVPSASSLANNASSLVTNAYNYANPNQNDSWNNIKDWNKGTKQYNGLTYRYAPKEQALEFTGGTLINGSDNNLYYESLNPQTVSKNNTNNQLLGTYLGASNDNLVHQISVKAAKSIKFDDDVDTSKVTDMSHMFQSDSNLESIDLGNKFNTRNVTNMDSMFKSDTSLKTLKLPNSFNTTNVSDMEYMFASDVNLDKLVLPIAFNTHKASSSWPGMGDGLAWMFTNAFANGAPLVIQSPDTFTSDGPDSGGTNTNAYFSPVVPKSELFADSNLSDVTKPISDGYAKGLYSSDSKDRIGTWYLKPVSDISKLPYNVRKDVKDNIQDANKAIDDSAKTDNSIIGNSVIDFTTMLTNMFYGDAGLDSNFMPDNYNHFVSYLGSDYKSSLKNNNLPSDLSQTNLIKKAGVTTKGFAANHIIEDLTGIGDLQLIHLKHNKDFNLILPKDTIESIYSAATTVFSGIKDLLRSGIGLLGFKAAKNSAINYVVSNLAEYIEKSIGKMPEDQINSLLGMASGQESDSFEEAIKVFIHPKAKMSIEDLTDHISDFIGGIGALGTTFFKHPYYFFKK